MRLELGALLALAVASLVFTTVAHGAGVEALAQTLPGYMHWFALGMGLAVVSATLLPRPGLPVAMHLGTGRCPEP